MTSTIRVRANNNAVLVTTYEYQYPHISDLCISSEGFIEPTVQSWKLTNEVTLTPDDGEKTYYCSPTRYIKIVDIKP